MFFDIYFYTTNVKRLHDLHMKIRSYENILMSPPPTPHNKKNYVDP